MQATTNQKFKIQINFTKAYEAEDGVAYIEGIASGPEVDLTGERMALSALQSMVDSFKKGIIEFRDAHKQEWNDDLGELVELSLTEDKHLFYKSKIDLNLSASRDLFYRITKKNKQYGVSIGGRIIQAGKEFVAEQGRDIVTYFEVAMDELSITRQAAYQHSFANVVTKSLPRNEEPMKPSVQKQVDTTTINESAAPDTNLTDTESAASTDANVEVHNEIPPQDEAEPQAVTEEAAAEQADAHSATATEAQSPQETGEQPVDATNYQTDQAAATDATEDKHVVKSATLDDWTEADMTADAVQNLAWKLQNYIWYWMQIEDTSAADKTKAIEAAIADFHQLIMKVVAVLVQDGNTIAVQRAAKAFHETSPKALTKSLADRDTTVETLSKPLAAKSAELEMVQTAINAKDEAMAEAKQSLDEVTKAKDAAELELEKINGRKTVAFNKGVKKVIVADDKAANPSDEPTIRELYLQKIGALPSAT